MAISVPPKGDASKKLGANFAPLSVTAQDTPNLSVKILPGWFYNSDGNVIEYSGGNSPTITPPASNAKWVIVTITDTGSIALVQGVASATPQLPALPAERMPLAFVYITSSMTTITNEKVFDARPLWRSESAVGDIEADLADRPTFTDVDNDLATKADIDGTPSYSFALNKNDSPAADAMFVVKRGASNDVMIRWNESTDLWEMTNDGITFSAIASTPESVSLNDLSDVTLTSVAANNVLQYDGAEWVNRSRVVLEAGTAALPTYTFTGDTDSGMYHSGANEISFSFGGVQHVKLDASGIVTFSAYKTAERGPVALKHQDDSDDSGVCFPSPGVVTIRSNGQVVATFNSNHHNNDNDNNDNHDDHHHHNRYVKRAGDTMTGFLTLNANPVNPLHAATKQYVDANSGGGNEPANQIVYGTGTGVDSDPDFTYTNTTGALYVNSIDGQTGSVSSATPGFIGIIGADCSAATGAGGQITLRGGLGGATAGDGGGVIISGGNAQSTLGQGGTVEITGGNSSTVDDGGFVTLRGGDGRIGGRARLFGGTGSDTGGEVTITAGDSGTGTDDGHVTISAGQPGGQGGYVNVVTHQFERLRINGDGGWELAGDQGTAGYQLTSNGSGVPPTWNPAAGIQPTNQILYGTGTGVESDPDFTYDNTTGAFYVNTTDGLASSVFSSGVQADLSIFAASRSDPGTGGQVRIRGGDGSGATPGKGGRLDIYGGDNEPGSGGGIDLIGGQANNLDGFAGVVRILGGFGGGGGGATIIAGGDCSGTGVGGFLSLTAGSPSNNDGSDVTVTASAGAGTDKNGGNVIITAGAKTGSGTRGVITLLSTVVLATHVLASLPTVVAGGMIFVSDAAAGAGRIAYGNTAAAAWIDPQTGVAVA